MLSALATTLRSLGRRLADDERGAGLIEYTLLVALIAIACFGALSFFGGSSEGTLHNSKTCMEAAYAGEPPPEGCE